MTNLIKKVIGVWESGGVKAEAVLEIECRLTGPEYRIFVKSLPFPRIYKQTFVELDNGQRLELPIREIGTSIPDRTGVLVVFDEKANYFADVVWFAPPHNAAIFNADGTLRFQLKNPHGESGAFRSTLHNYELDGSVEVGVRACPNNWSVCEEVYMVDGSTDDLSTQIPRWVRD